MALPLIGIGAALIAAYAGGKLSEHYQKRKGSVGAFPGELDEEVIPTTGAILTCGVYGLFDHSGIWCDGHVVELKGNGLVRAVTPKRFISERSGSRIYVACDEQGRALENTAAMERATEQIYQYYAYDVFKNNCHRFVWRCIADEERQLTRFAELNAKLSGFYQTAIHWHPARF